MILLLVNSGSINSSESHTLVLALYIVVHETFKLDKMSILYSFKNDI